MPLAVGRTFAGRYEIRGLLGEGGMGVVYRATDLQLGRDVALKVVVAKDVDAAEGATEGRARLVREARAAASLHHPNAVAIFDAGEAEEIAFLAMELIEGRTLRSLIGVPTPLERRVSWLRDVARGLAAAHAVGLVHRDIKPENVLVTTDGVAKVLDFGIARRLRTLVDAAAKTEAAGIPTDAITGAGLVIGTPFYMAPEQMRGETLDARTDQYSWGVLAFEVLTGELPWGPERDALAMVARVFAGDTPSPRAKRPDIPETLDAVVRRAMALRPSDRFASMQELGAALGDGAPIAFAPTVAVRPTRSRRPLVFALAVAVALPAVALIALIGRREQPPPVATVVAGSASSSGRGVAITDLPLPKTSSPEALAAYVDGIRAYRAGSGDVARSALEKATTLDPELAEAHLRLAGHGFGNDPRGSLRRAVRLRMRLSPRDQGILDALVEGEASASNETLDALLDALRAQYPLDAEIAALSTGAKLRRGDTAGVEATARRALQLDPEFAEVMSSLQLALVDFGRFDEEDALGSECLRRWGSEDCAVNHAAARSYVGDVDGTRRVAERGLLLNDTSQNFALFHASALHAGGASVETLRAALARARGHGSAYLDKARLDAPLAMASGDLGRAIDTLESALAEAPATRHWRSSHTLQLVRLLRETGRTKDAVRVATAYRDALPTLSETPYPSAEQSFAVLHELVDLGVMSRSEVERARDDHVAKVLARLAPGGHPHVWGAFHGALVSTRDEAEQALREMVRLGTPLSTDFHFNPFGLVGRVRLLAGDARGALPELERAAREVRFLFDPWSAVRARLDLGRGLEETGDAGRACAAYAEVLAQWGAARPGSNMATEAKKRHAALRCGK